jgi:hypothetical protein
MVVPGVILQKISVAKIELVATYPEIIEPTEDIPFSFSVVISSQGNKDTQFQLDFLSNTGEEEIRSGSIQPNETQTISITLKRPSLAMRQLEAILTWKQDKESPKPQKKIIPIRVQERKDKVEFKFGGLDKLME